MYRNPQYVTIEYNIVSTDKSKMVVHDLNIKVLLINVTSIFFESLHEEGNVQKF